MTVKASLITTVYNEIDSIGDFLDSLADFSVKPDEVVIVDGGSTDGTAEKIENFIKNKTIDVKIKLIIDNTCNLKHSPSPVAKGRNLAIENTSNETIAVTDAGCIPDKYWFEKITEPFAKDNDIHAVAGWYKPIIKNRFQKCAYPNIFPDEKRTLENPDNFLPSSRSVAFTKSAWLKVGKYPETYLTAEDTLFDLKIIKKYGCFYFVPEAFVSWEVKDNLKDYAKLIYKYALGDGFENINHKLLLRAILRFFLFLAPVIIILQSSGIIGTLILVAAAAFLTKQEWFCTFILSLVREFVYIIGYIQGYLGYDLQTKKYVKKNRSNLAG